ncbi:TPM domain-containing protein [Bradyrhizobium sp. LHD-71]|uniref:TPM domain-containing protein n=1 Tax=Bradyrhizobium sp. LHD-71 TaxID=3072141 RepID=UPI00281039F0|nr:TPM domain-containing protein [Bradyrhizobium sp. LHD-71]MDQ8728117.1 TPM domain-containing protein [Bradyrhizobium sp. LHD-71]
MRGLSSARLCIIAAVMVALAAVAAHALTFPPLTGRVVDDAGILDAQTKQALTDKLAAVEAKTGQQIVVVTLKSLEGTSIEDYGYQLGRAWGIGQKDKNNGALLIVAPNERKVRIEVGYGLEGTLTDAISQLIIQNGILPRFRAGDFAGGITRGVDDMVQVASGDAEDYQRRAEQRPDAAPQIDWATILFALFFLYVMYMMMRNARGGGQQMNRRGGYVGPIFIPSGGSWSSGSWGGGGGGGFSGGGGSFGGGGSSGSW